MKANTDNLMLRPAWVPPPPPDFRGNGMGTKATRPLVKALLWWARALDLDRTAAREHDWAYSRGRPLAYLMTHDDARAACDRAFWCNIHTQIDARWSGWHRAVKRWTLGRLLAWACYRAVRDFGFAAFGKA